MNREERLRQARESLEEAGFLASEKIGTKAVLAKLYHAMMYSLFALLDISDLRRLSHADVIERFEREYRETTFAVPEFFAALRRAYDLTHECDCDHMPVPTDEDIKAVQHAAENLIHKVEGLLRTDVKVDESSAV